MNYFPLSKHADRMGSSYFILRNMPLRSWSRGWIKLWSLGKWVYLKCSADQTMKTWSGPRLYLVSCILHINRAIGKKLNFG